MSDYKPITGELRELLADMNWTEIIDHVQTNGGAVLDGDWLNHWHEHAEHVCDAIDAVHAELEKENERLRRELRGRPTVARLERENAALKAELDRALGEQEKATTNIAEATVTVKPVLDWSGVAHELRAIADMLAGEAE